MISHASRVANDSSSVSDIQVWQVLNTDARTMHKRPYTATVLFIARVWAGSWAEIRPPHYLGGIRNNFADQILKENEFDSAIFPVHDAQ